MNEQLYQDVISKIFPKIEAGIQITKEYILDVGARYIKYLIITDIIWIVVSVILIIAGFVAAKILFDYIKKEDRSERSEADVLFVPLIGVLIGIFILLGIHINYLIQDVYLPEIRIIEILHDKSN